MSEEVASGDTEYVLPCAEALIAAALALMTAHAQAGCEVRRSVMEAKIVANLSQLEHQCVLTPQFRAAMRSLRAHWETIRGHGEAFTARDKRFWHPAPALFQ